ncbi:hypothetical protein F5888DRAFT_1793967 [Russula emetica]|nr:hypothetical protein F5888DRAFT_1793967 [Russula emetica]
MSAESIARWNAIPMTRPEHDDGDDSDDDVSLVSRSPSPVAQDQMDIDKYDDYVRGPVREVITVDTKIKSTNKGFKMLSKLGWVEGQPLGLSQDARVDPIPFHIKNDATGLGKTSQDFRMIETTVSQRRELDSERQRNETEEQRKAREGNVARRAALQTEISEVLRPFYCTVCEKQFKNVAQYDEHTNSYAHHHKIRFRDMQTTQRAKQNTREEQDKRKEKERKREEKELRKIAAAAGVRMAKPLTASTTATVAPVVPSAESKPVGFKKGSWASVSSVTPEPPSSTESPPARSGWGAVGCSSVTSVPSHSPSPAPDAVSSVGFPTTTPVVSSQPGDQGDPSIPEPAKEAQRRHHQPAPAFRTGGWSSMDSTTRVPPPPTPAPDVPALAMANVHRQPGHLASGPASITPSAPETVPTAVHLPPPVPPHSQASANPRTEAPKSSKSKKEKEAEMRENARSGWQSFQKGGRRK